MLFVWATYYSVHASCECVYVYDRERGSESGKMSWRKGAREFCVFGLMAFAVWQLTGIFVVAGVIVVV